MELGEIIKDAIAYPTSNIKALALYLVLGIIIGIIQVVTGTTSLTKGSLTFSAGTAVGIIGLILIICISFLMLGFSLDVIKFGIDRRSDAPGIDLARQISNGLRYFLLCFIYLLIPIIILGVFWTMFQNWLVVILGVVLAIVFAFALMMSICRLAKTDSLGESLDLGVALDDLHEIGVGKVVITLIVATIVGMVIVFLLSFILGLILSAAPGDVVTAVVSIVTAILDAWLLFYENRIMGLLYSHGA